MKILAKAALLLTVASIIPAGAQINAGDQKPEASVPFNLAQVTTFDFPWRLVSCSTGGCW